MILPGIPDPSPEGMQNIVYILPRPLPLSHQRAMPAIRIAVQSGQMRNPSRPERVQMDIPNQFLKIGLFLAYNGFIPILWQMPMALVPPIETDHIPGQQSPYQSGKGNFARPRKKVSMIWQEGSGKASRLCFQQKLSQPFKKILPVAITPIDLSAFNTPDDNMMKNYRSIQAS
jgi:hypothetical protein